MKKVFIAVVALMVGASAISQTKNEKSNLEFNRYIAKRVSSSYPFAKDNIQGVIRVKIDLSEDGFKNVNLLTGLSPELDEQVVSAIKNTPKSIASKLAADGTTSVIVPVRFVIEEL
jgi:outer membrane biosynthesis protein TonB